jgi:integrase
MDGNYKRPTINTEIPIKGNNKRLANEKLKEVIAEYNSQNVDFSKDILFADFMKNWLETCRISNAIQPTTHDAYALTLNTHILPYFSHLKLKLRDIMPQHIQQYVNYKLKTQAKRKKPLSINTVKKHLANISACLESAVHQNIIAYNPATRIQRMKKIEYEGARPLRAAEIEQVIKFFDGDPLEIVVRIALFYGLRRSEILGLKWGAINFDDNEISIEHTIVKVIDTHHKQETKNASSKSKLPLPNEIKIRLLEWKEEQARRKALQPNDYVDSDYICTMFDGRFMQPNYVTKHFKLIIAKNNFPDMRFHDLRHSSGTYLKSIGLDTLEIKTWLRHADIQSTLRYTHMDMEAKQGISDKLAEKMAKMGL